MRRVWGRRNSINVMKVLWCLEELGLPYEHRDAGGPFGGLDDPGYLALNPNGKVPTLEDEGVVVWESNVIVRYLAARYGLGTLCPEAPAERAHIEQWMDWQQLSLGPEITYVFMGLVRNRPDAQDPERRAAAIRSLDHLFGILDRHLEGRDFVGGSRLTMGDIPVGAAVWRWQNLPIERSSRPNVEAWHERLKERPGFRQHVMLPLT
jgi:glutathione S-transferase